jgi:predicted membrane protein
MENKPEKTVSQSMEDLFHAIITSFFTFLRSYIAKMLIIFVLLIGLSSVFLFQQFKSEEATELAQQKEAQDLKQENELLKKQFVEQRVSNAYNAGRNDAKREIELGKNNKNNRPYQLVSPIYESN